MKPKEFNLEDFDGRLKSIELRLAHFESELIAVKSFRSTDHEENNQLAEAPLRSQITADEDKGLESRIGRIGLAWIGNIVLFFTVLILTEYLITNGHRLLSVCIGIMSVGMMLLISWYFKKSLQNLSFMLNVNSQVILYYQVLRIYFFNSQPLIENKSLVLLLLLTIAGFQIYVSIKDRSQVFGFVAIAFILFTAILSDSTHILLPLVTSASILAVYYFYRMKWQILLIVSILLCYTVYISWLFGNPFMGHNTVMLSAHNYGHIYLFALGGCFSVLPLFYKSDDSINDLLISTIILNGIFFTLILAFITTKYFSNNYVIPFSIITLFCIIYSIILKSKTTWKFSSAYYALYGFLAMSISMYGIVGIPKVYMLLSVQSLIVISIALWFRNRIMIVMNSLLFLSILLFYMISSKPIDAVNFSFAFVPLISARVINWQKERLDIKTDYIRNLYLIVAFIMVLFALFHALPKSFITLSWTLAALFYFMMSFILKNIKYRYMALGTMICAAIYLLFVDLASIEIIYKILALLFLAVVSIGISMFYNKKMTRPE